ncbi:NifX-associated nitrogen fixation protein [Roseospira goensis]|uniref:Putative nitrogen fixation protein n=1 Tax=Roseospira goensis TaxID=391922 RepID=A0A7W6S0Z9_9PROT|nr:NifX-associated nitrogen fixation protein [Roseospira goensis]MBB4286864.1 putative nitrogen fixation protein [Roseospira goensis]
MTALARKMAARTLAPEPAWPADPVFLPELAALIRAGDCCGLWEGKSDARLLGGYVVTRDQRRAIPILGEPDPRVLRRLHTYYQAVGTAIGRHTGHVATPLVDLSDEGFGRVVLIAGRLVAVARPLRDVHRFGFDDLAALDAAGAALVEEGAAMIAGHPALVAA